MRVFLDTNVLVSALATRGLCADVLRIVVARHRLVVGETVLAELRRILRDKFGVPHDAARAAERFLRAEGIVVGDAPSLGIELCDPDDIPVLEEAVAGKADVLVTGDRDLLEIARQAPLPIIAPRGLWEELGSDSH